MIILTLPRDVGLDKDNFQKSKIFNTTDSLINYILNILIMRPGNMPGMPELGVNIGQYVHPKMQTQLDTNLLKGLIMSNCEALLPYLSSDDLYIGIAVDEDGRDVLIIKIPMVVDEISREERDVYYAFYRSQLNELKFNFLVDDGL
jgi:hypothetical protein